MHASLGFVHLQDIHVRDHADCTIRSNDGLAGGDKFYSAATMNVAMPTAWERLGPIATPEPDPVLRWISVAFLQPERADEVLDMTMTHGVDSAIRKALAPILGVLGSA